MEKIADTRQQSHQWQWDRQCARRRQVEPPPGHLENLAHRQRLGSDRLKRLSRKLRFFEASNQCFGQVVRMDGLEALASVADHGH
jgi:hypothetical protein